MATYKKFSFLFVSFIYLKVFRVHPCRVFFFVLLHNIPYHILFVHQLVDIWVVCDLWLFWIMFLWTFVYRVSYGHTFSFLSGRYPEVELVILCLAFWRTARLFSRQIVHSVYDSFSFSPSLIWSYLLSIVFPVWRGVSLWFRFAFPSWVMMLRIFMCLLAICLSSLENCWFRPLVWPLCLTQLLRFSPEKHTFHIGTRGDMFFLLF